MAPILIGAPPPLPASDASPPPQAKASTDESASTTHDRSELTMVTSG
jgi:hypothetical protein